MADSSGQTGAGNMSETYHCERCQIATVGRTSTGICPLCGRPLTWGPVTEPHVAVEAGYGSRRYCRKCLRDLDDTIHVPVCDEKG